MFSNPTHYSYEWANTVVKIFEEKYARATKIGLLVLHLRHHQLVFLLQHRPKQWHIVRDWMKALEKQLQLLEDPNRVLTLKEGDLGGFTTWMYSGLIERLKRSHEFSFVEYVGTLTIINETIILRELNISRGGGGVPLTPLPLQGDLLGS